jgi:hypothetical protein
MPKEVQETQQDLLDVHRGKVRNRIARGVEQPKLLSSDLPLTDVGECLWECPFRCPCPPDMPSLRLPFERRLRRRGNGLTSGAGGAAGSRIVGRIVSRSAGVDRGAIRSRSVIT